MEGRAGKNRNIFVVWLVWPLITLGIYSYIWYYKVNREARDFDSRIEVNPVVALLAVLLGWIIIVPPFVSIYRTGERIAKMQRAAGLEPTCSAIVGLLLTFVFGLESLYYQYELNRMWDHYGNPPEGTPVTLALQPQSDQPPIAKTAGPQRIGWVCALDFGTSYTKAAVRRLDEEEPQVVRFGGLRAFPSAVYIGPDKRWLVGDDASTAAGTWPSRAELRPKRLVGDRDIIYLGGDAPDMQPYRVVDIVAHVLRKAFDHALAAFPGTLPDEVRATYPEAWGEDKQNMLIEAVHQAGVPPEVPVRLISETEAAAFWVRRRCGGSDQGSDFGVYDFGGGSLDTAVVRQTARGFTPIARRGQQTIGGHDLDMELFERAGRRWGDEYPREWNTLRSSPDNEWRASKEEAIQRSKRAKEALSRQQKASVRFRTPSGGGPADGGWDIEVTREDFERWAQPTVTRSLDELGGVCRLAGVTQKLPVYLSGGSSRIPLVQREVHRCYEKPVDWERVSDDPELVVVQGAAI
jgi:molecular chaperone DnaK (HSP70)